MEDDWDLYAVVRGCATAAATTSCSIDFHLPSIFQPKEDRFLFFSDPLPRNSESSKELYDLFKPFSPKSPFSVLGGLHHLSPPPPPPPATAATTQHRRQQSQQKQEKQQQHHSATHTPSPRSKRRKIQLKRVCEVPAEGLSSDTWSWRKYGQKPIKGSPYPRGYYRCSTSKGCLARKQVERNRSDPGMFIVTYTAEHNHPMPTHRNSLAGITRPNPVNPESIKAGDASKSPSEEKMESREERESEEDDEFCAVDMGIEDLSDDFFEVLEGLAGTSTGDGFSGHFPTIDSMVWACLLMVLCFTNYHREREREISLRVAGGVFLSRTGDGIGMNDGEALLHITRERNFFQDSEELAGVPSGDCFSCHFPARDSVVWLEC